MAGRNATANVLKFSIPLVAGLALLSSCVSVNEQLTINSDGSGVLELSYQVARLALSLSQPDNPVNIVPLPANPREFQSAVQRVSGLKMESFKPIENADTVGATSTLAFTAVSELSQVLGARSGVSFTLTGSGNSTVFRQTLYPGNPKGVNAETLSLVKELFGDERLVFSLQAPYPVQSVNIGALSPDRRTAHYTTTVPEIIQAKAPVVWEVRW